MKNIINSESISRFVIFPTSNEPDSTVLSDSYRNGSFIGNSERFSVPIFINPEDTVNPHILICGMTGGGKTFFAKSLVTRLHLFSEANIIVIDFTGEYASVLSNVSSSDTGLEQVFSESHGIFYLDLHDLREKDKVAKASEILEYTAVLMRSRKSGHKRRIFILLDEAWKLVENNKGLEIIIREGRKYGTGLITSSQLLHDTSSNILSNVATLFIFKTTNKSSLDRLSKSYSLNEAEIYKIQNLDLGSCFLVQLKKSGIRSAFQVRKIIGVKDSGLITIRSVINMDIKIEKTEFEFMIRGLCGQTKTDIITEATKNNSIELTYLINKLIESGADRASILKEIKKLGFLDSDIADSFSIALNRSDANGFK